MKYFITGGAGFIGAHLVNHLLDTTKAEVTVFDNFSNGRRWAYGARIKDSRLRIIEGEINDRDVLCKAMVGHDVVYHLAANPDIARAAVEPDIDFRQGTQLANNVLEAMRQNGVRRILFTSGSGVYGELGAEPVAEEYPRMIPISTYGASKLACESLISAYCHMFDMQGTVFRFANVVGPHQTHGVAYDFIRRLAKDSSKLLIYGDGAQSKPYVHVSDVVAAFRLLERVQQSRYDVFNVGTDDHLTVREIADVVVRTMELHDVVFAFTGGARGWKGDVPVYRLNTSKVRAQGWQPGRNSRQAVETSVVAMVEDLREGRLRPAT